MKGLRRAGCLFLVLAALLLVGRSRSDTRPAPRPTRVAVVELSYVFPRYKKSQEAEKELRRKLDTYRKRHEEYMEKGEALKKEIKSADSSAERKQAATKELEGLLRTIEANKEEALKAGKKTQAIRLKAVYDDVRAAAQRYAKAHQIDLVLYCNDGSANEAGSNPELLLEQLQLGRCGVLHSLPGIDISKEIVAILNDDLRHQKGNDPAQ